MKNNFERIEFSTRDDNYSGWFFGADSQHTVIILPDWQGQHSQFAMRRGAELHKQLGLNVLVTDPYGVGYHPEKYDGDAEIWISAALSDPQKLRQRMSLLVESASNTLGISLEAVTVVGYCLGGALSFELGRSGLGVAGVVSVHGIPSTQKPIFQMNCSTRFLAIHGAADPIIGMEHITSFQNEMTKANVDWQTLVIGHVRHGYTNEDISTDGEYQRYSRLASERTILSIKQFIIEFVQ